MEYVKLLELATDPVVNDFAAIVCIVVPELKLLKVDESEKM